MDILNEHRSARHKNAKVLTALLIITFGTLYLLERTGMKFPDWLVSWESILISAGAVTLYKHKFQSFTGYVLLFVGGIFLADEIIPGIVDKRYIFPIIIIGFGVAMLFKTLNIFQPKNKNKSTTMFDEDVDMSSDDYISSSVVFGAVEKNVMSKDFKGGEFKTAFGGTEINLTQADIQQPVTIDVSTAFGGLQLIIPSEWEIKSNVTTMFGSIEDKRPSQGTVTSDPNKVVTLQGSCVFGGVEIVSYK